MSKLERGFKSWAERIAVAVRAELALGPSDPLDGRRLADHLGVQLITPRDVPGIGTDVLTQLLDVDPTGWSAVSYALDGGTTVILNPKNSLARQASDLMHELSHQIRGHQPSLLIMSEQGDFALRSFDGKQEDEATWLGATLLLPRPALLAAAAEGMNNAEIAERFGVSKSLTDYRVRMTGIDRQVSSRGKRGPSGRK